MSRKSTSPRPAAAKATTVEAVPHSAPGQVSKGAQPLTLARLDVMPPVHAAGESEDTVLGRQLTAQWEKVKSNRMDDLLFGAMMLKLRERIRGSARGTAQGNEARKGTGLKGWLAAHAPSVSESIAHRMMDIAEGVVDALKLGKVDLEMLLSAQVENLDARLAKKRAEIEKVIDGKSQRQLLLDFGKAPSKSKGGNQHAKCPHCKGNLRHSLQQVCPHCDKPTGIELPEGYDPQEAEAIDLWTPILRSLREEGIDRQSFVHLPDKGEVSRETLKGLLTDLSKALRDSE